MPMIVMLVGGGGREHAILEKLRKSPKISKIYALPGNGGMEPYATCVPISATDLDAIVDFAKENAIDFAVIGPDDPLILGLVDRLYAIGIRCFGPSGAAAQIEGSKLFSKNLMRKYGIPTAEFKEFDKSEEAYRYLRLIDYPTVVKADGPALGKGVFVVNSTDEARSAVHELMELKRFGESGGRIVIEEFLSGNEVSVLAFTDGKTLMPMVSALDHKRAYDGDLGPNTGGMGALAPNPFYTEADAALCMERIFLPTLKAMNAEGRKFKGCLYFGLMLTKDGPKVIEYNCRFGDPETQAVLTLLDTDLFEIMLAVEEECLDEIDVQFQNGSACCVVMTSRGYPKAYETGFEVTFRKKQQENVVMYHAGTRGEGSRLLTSGGRVLGVTAVCQTPKEAVKSAYTAVKDVRFENAFYRTDIGRRALEAFSKEKGI